MKLPAEERAKDSQKQLHQNFTCLSVHPLVLFSNIMRALLAIVRRRRGFIISTVPLRGSQMDRQKNFYYEKNQLMITMVQNASDEFRDTNNDQENL